MGVGVVVSARAGGFRPEWDKVHSRSSKVPFRADFANWRRFCPVLVVGPRGTVVDR